MIFFIAVGCARQPIRDVGQAMRLTSRPVESLKDDLAGRDFDTLLDDHVKYFKALPDFAVSKLKFGPVDVLTRDYALALEALRVEVVKPNGMAKVSEFVHDHFDLYEVYGQESWGDVFMTGYFDPVIKGSSTPTHEYYRPVYRQPDDLLLLRMDEFASRFSHLSAWATATTEQKSPPGVLRGRLAHRGTSLQVVPYWSRREIDGLGLLRGQGLEIAYVDPVDIFVLQIQGSGTIELKDGTRLRVGYAAQNGYPYVPIGKFLLQKIPKDKMSLQAIETHLRSLPPREAEELMAQNPSYVFFATNQGEPKSTIGTAVRPGRSIATDREYFPKGTLAFLEFSEPQVSAAGLVEGLKPTSRFVMDQDTGGAIRGAGRLDLFCGEGESGKKLAGVLKNHGKLLYLVPKPQWLVELKGLVKP